jgi:hypothetical protein
VTGRGAVTLLAALVQAFNVSRAFERWKKKAKLAAFAAALAAAALFALLGALGCAVAALWIYLLPYAGPVGTPLILSGGLLVLCLILLAAAYVLARRKPRVKGAGLATSFKPLLEAVLTGFALGSKTKNAKPSAGNPKSK